MQPYVIGIDIGTGSTKAVAINASGEVIATAQFYYSMLIGPTGYAEQDPELIWKAFVNCIKKISNTIQRLPVTVSLSSCMHSLMVIDSSHKPLTNIITWADTRSEKIADEIRRSPEAENIYRATGTPIHSMSPLCKIIWFKRNAPLVFANAFKYVSVKEFIWYRLFNIYQVDYSIASATGLFNIENFKWNSVSLKLCGIAEDQLSAIVSSNYIRKDLNDSSASLLNIPSGTPFCIGASDGCLANIGSCAIEQGIAAVTIGTSGAVRVANASPVFNYPCMTFNYVLDEKTFICGGPVNNGGNVLEWLFKTFLFNSKPSAEDYLIFFKTIEAVPAGSNGLVFLPYLYGERAPVWDEKACGVFLGIRSYHTNEYFLRAALEGICYALKNVLEIVESSTGIITQLNVSGGFVRSKVWMQILADVTGKKICLFQTEDASAIGAALLGMKALHIIDDYSSHKPENNVILEPFVNNNILYEKYYSVFKEIYLLLKASMHRLHEINLTV